MRKRFEIYKCEVCGNIVEVVGEGNGTMVCCSQPMKHQQEGVVDAAAEKHVPVIEKKDDGYFVKVGDVEHPMLDNHYIEWIELLADGKSYTQYFKPGEKPEAFFKIEASSVTAREYCNLHGLWKNEG